MWLLTTQYLKDCGQDLNIYNITTATKADMDSQPYFVKLKMS